MDCTLVTTNEPILIHYSFTCYTFSFSGSYLGPITLTCNISLRSFWLWQILRLLLFLMNLDILRTIYSIWRDSSHWDLSDVFLMITLGYIFWKVEHKLKCLFNYIVWSLSIISWMCHCLGEPWSPGWSNVSQVSTMTFISPHPLPYCPFLKKLSCTTHTWDGEHCAPPPWVWSICINYFEFFCM